eukprot:CAMPEP_0206307072 /NCGR_PEP_ID=MMETSP0106_2-20121207/11137_1 /ASSEMBLY_ACC=CAM_ASM_000206 /TAXON_ID=81532 /ORGANISM="Acanthoeca-like sp., Strain 10tr" /LENGTH=477 /DNA_ID=CAMNT_0053738033 /DNA_START=108 /DNA_END=1541 /DNA_ORIENTATION=+
MADGGLAVVIVLEDDCGVEPRVFHPGDAVNGSVWVSTPAGRDYLVERVELTLSAREHTSVVSPANSGAIIGGKQVENKDVTTLFHLPTLVLCGSTIPGSKPEHLPGGTTYRLPFAVVIPDTAPTTYAVSAMGSATTIGNARVKTMLAATAFIGGPKGRNSSYAIELPVSSKVHLEDALQRDHKRSLDHQNHFSSCCGSSFDTDLHIDRATFCYGELCKFSVSHGIATSPKSHPAVRRTKIKGRLKAVTEFKAAGFKTRREYYGNWFPGKLTMDGGNCCWDFAVELVIGDTCGDVLPRHSFLGENILVKWYIELSFQKSRFTRWNKFHHLYMCNVITSEQMASHPHTFVDGVATKKLPAMLRSSLVASHYPSYTRRVQPVKADSIVPYSTSVDEMPDQGEQLMQLVKGRHRDVGPKSTWLDNAKWVGQNLQVVYLGAPLAAHHGVHRAFSGSVTFKPGTGWLQAKRINSDCDVKVSQI